MVQIGPCNAWRHGAYTSPPDKLTPGDAACIIEALRKTRLTASREQQAERRRVTGYAGPHSEAANAIYLELRKLGHRRSTCEYAAHLAAAGEQYNFQGQFAIARWMFSCDRTCRRARAILEEAGFITSYLLQPGEMLPGQHRPVKRPQVVRDVSALHRLANVHSSGQSAPRRGKAGRRGKRRVEPKSPSASVSSPASICTATADDFEELAALNPEFARYFVGMAAARRETPVEAPPAPKPPRPSKPAIAEPPAPEELDALDAELLGHAALERGPP